MTEFASLDTVVTVDRVVPTSTLAWNKHATCPGVFLKHLVTGESTKGHCSIHLVKVEAHCAITEHIHESKWELHEVLAGDGRGAISGASILYSPGTTIVIPESMRHRVEAGDHDLYLRATFIPALI
jgi:quercetin dioxygenase-like cupin family protein